MAYLASPSWAECLVSDVIRKTYSKKYFHTTNKRKICIFFPLNSEYTTSRGHRSLCTSIAREWGSSLVLIEYLYSIVWVVVAWHVCSDREDEVRESWTCGETCQKHSKLDKQYKISEECGGGGGGGGPRQTRTSIFVSVVMFYIHQKREIFLCLVTISFLKNQEFW